MVEFHKVKVRDTHLGGSVITYEELQSRKRIEFFGWFIAIIFLVLGLYFIYTNNYSFGILLFVLCIAVVVLLVLKKIYLDNGDVPLRDLNFVPERNTDFRPRPTIIHVGRRGRRGGRGRHGRHRHR